MSNVFVHKGTGDNDSISLAERPGESLEGLRERLQASGFIGADEAPGAGKAGHRYRFVNMRQRDFGSDRKVTIDRDLESVVPVAKVGGQGNQVILSDLLAKRPDLVGMGVDWFFDRFLAVRVSVNHEDDRARQGNAKLGDMRPMMLSDVVPTTDIAGYWRNVCVCVEGSMVGFEVRSWGAMGFEVDISDDLSGSFWQRWARFDDAHKNSYGSMYARHYGADKTIQIRGADSLNIVGRDELVRFQKVTVRSRRVTAYSLNGVKHQSTDLPPSALPRMRAAAAAAPAAAGAAAASDSIARELVKANAQNSTVTVPGDSIKVGGPSGGPATDAPLGGGQVDSWEIDDWSQALGEVSIYFFVFKSEQAARRVIDGYNSPRADVWS